MITGIIATEAIPSFQLVTNINTSENKKTDIPLIAVRPDWILC